MKVKEKIKKYSQEQLLKFEDELKKEQKEKLYNQINELDFSYLDELKNNQTIDKGKITPIKAMTINEIEKNKSKYEEIGIKALQNYEVGTLLLAGGMGTRLGSDNPKGMYNIGKTKDVFIFQRLFENLLDVVKKCGKYIPFFIMTSEKNHKVTTEFLEGKNYFGYDKNFVKFFVQEMAPCVDLKGKILLESKDRIATSPNGNGGWFNSLLNNIEAKEMLEKYNIKWLNVFSVDNVLQKIADPIFVGATINGNFEVSSKVIRKVDPFEKVGVMCNKNGKPSIVEYIDLTNEMAVETDENGERVYNFGVVLNYLFNVDTLYKIKDNKLPVHIVTKKVEYINDDGVLVKPSEPNAHKFEMLCVDMIEYCNSCLPFEVERKKEFAPVKNKTGVDSVESAQNLLEENGYKL
ncbi:MAG: UDPGP type 1 family protein [Clostridiales bacterium]|nr:UDPGP type 1 family protein [Clostridiales bacterium]